MDRKFHWKREHILTRDLTTESGEGLNKQGKRARLGGRRKESMHRKPKRAFLKKLGSGERRNLLDVVRIL